MGEENSIPPLLGGRYKIDRKLGQGGFGVTFLAKDVHRPSQPSCVVKQLNPNSEDSSLLEIAKRLFNSEAEVLDSLGKHPQIPELLAYFDEDNRFYLVQQFIDGHDLENEVIRGQKWQQEKTIAFLKEILQVLSFVHQRQVIHRDIKPANLMRRSSDSRLFLIDFGAVKQKVAKTFKISQADATVQIPSKTVGIGSLGYMPGEQAKGHPQLSSDVYAVGIIAIQALTGKHPEQFEIGHDGELVWRDEADVSFEIANIIDKMVRCDFRHRYNSAVEALAAINSLSTQSKGKASVKTDATVNTVVRSDKKLSKKVILLSITLISLLAISVPIYLQQSKTTEQQEDLSNPY